MSLSGSNGFDDLFSSPEFTKECLSIIGRYVDDEDDIYDVFVKTYIQLQSRNLNHVNVLEAYIKDSMRYSAIAFLTKKKNNKEKPANQLNELPGKSLAPAKMRYDEIRQAIRKYRSELDYIFFELYSWGYKYEEIAQLMNTTEAAVRTRKSNLFKWIKEHFNGE